MAEERFASVSESDIDQLLSSAIPESTRNKQRWAIKIFSEWLGRWCLQQVVLPKKAMVVEQLSDNELDICLQYFIPSVRKLDGSPYPPRTVKEMVALVQHYYNVELGRRFSIFTDTAFQESRRVLDAMMKKLARDGLVVPTKRSGVITYEMESELWDSAVLGDGNPQQLLDTMIFMLGLHLSLRACQEHRSLSYGEGGALELGIRDGVECLLYRYSMDELFCILLIPSLYIFIFILFLSFVSIQREHFKESKV
jgi:hypothetical protein